MAYLDPVEAFAELKKNTTKAVKSYFPLVGKKSTLDLEQVSIDDDTKLIDDIHAQKEAKEKGRSWAIPIRASLVLKDNETGKVLDKQTVTVGQLPKATPRHSYIVDGSEWQINNQFRLKSGVFTQIKENGELASQWNVERGPGFEMLFDPDSRKLSMRVKGSKLPLYPIMKALGMDDDALQKTWGKEILAANRTQGKKPQDRFLEQSIHKTHTALTGNRANTIAEAVKGIQETFGKTKLRADSTKVTLGKAFDTVDGKSLLAGSNKILQVSKGEEEPDNRDSLVFKDFLAAEDLLYEKLFKDSRRDINKKIETKLNDKSRIRDMVNPDTFGRPIKHFFTQSAISDRPDQTNPVQFLVGARRTTLSGEHGIGDVHRIPDPARSIDPSSAGFLDPVHTPENARIGTILQMGSAAKKVGTEIKTRVYNTRTGKTEYISPSEALKSNLAFGDQYSWSGGVPTPLHKDIRVTDPTGRFSITSPKDVDYVIRSPKGMFDISTNMIPFLQNNQGNRTSVASRQLEQAVPLVQREAPLVQVKGEGAKTWEQVVGSLNTHKTRVDGIVTRVSKDNVYIKGEDGESYKVPLYNDFPLNDNKAVLNSTAIVKAGDQVKAGQIVADSNFTDKGTLAIGTNLRVAYIPYHGYNFDDGVVISESASNKLKSEHMLRHSLSSDKDTILNKDTFFAHTSGQYSKEQAEKLDSAGVIKPGAVVQKGDVLIGALKKEQWRPEHELLSKFSNKLIPSVRSQPEIWDKDYPGVVTNVVRHGKETTVYVKAQTAAEVGDKIAGRHGNKSIITRILPDHEMPKLADGTHTELLINPAGVPGRINLGQVLETAASKIARKTGNPYVVNNFDPTVPNYTKKVKEELQKHGLSDTEQLFDPKTNRPIKTEPALVGEQFILKLHHTAEGGIKARSRGAYDLNEQPKKGPTGKAQSMDVGGLYALLAHGARENVREMQTVKADRNDDYWLALQSGESLPAPKIPFAYKKFEGYLRGMGVNVEKDGSRLKLTPLTDDQVLAISNGKLTSPTLALRSKDLKPEKGSLYDEKVTGTRYQSGILQMGPHWSHFTLSERMPNPVFEDPIKNLLGLSKPQYENLIAGKETLNGKTGPAAISDALAALDVDKELEAANAKIPSASMSKLSDLRKKARHLSALKEINMSPKDAYTMKHIPVLPPVMRPISVLPNGQLSTDDLTYLYGGIAKIDDMLSNPATVAAPDDIEGGTNDLRAGLYDGLKALTLTGFGQDKRHKKGIVEIIAGSSPKYGFFQNKMIKKRQDLSLRGVIVPETKLGVDEVEIPEMAAKEVYRPFVQRRLVRSGYTPGQAGEAINKGEAAARSALEEEMKERPLLLKRDPVLHKYGVQAFIPKLTTGSAVKIHPLATSGYNADFDGDKMSAFVPVSDDAVREAFDMLPTRNLFSPSTGKLMFKPSQESLLGLHDLSRFGKSTSHKFKDVDAAARAVQKGLINYTDVIQIDDPTLPSPIQAKAVTPLDKGLDYASKTAAAPVRTTVGRLLLQSSMPEDMRDPKLLTDKQFALDNDRVTAMLTAVAQHKDRQDFSTSANKLKDIGYRHATGFSFGLDDLLVDNSYRDAVFDQAKEVEKAIRSKDQSSLEKDLKLIELYKRVGDKVLPEAKKRLDKSDNRLYNWVKAGAKGNWNQFHQMAVAPVQVVDSSGSTVPVPIAKSYAEGLDSASYFASMYGARMGTIGRVKGTADPGALTKELMQASSDTLITSEDCGTDRGQHFKVGDANAYDRFLTKDIEIGTRGGKDKGVIPAGTLVTPAVMSRLRNNKVADVPVRSPLKCAEPHGICAKCFGLNENGKLHQKGVNIGVLATQALGEPLTQMAMNCNAAGNLVTVRTDEEVDTITFEQLWSFVDSFVDVDSGVETKMVEGVEVWDHDHFTPIHTMQRHRPTDDMVLVRLDDGRAFIVQADHPNWARKDVVSCSDCGHEEPVTFVGHYKDKSKTSVRCSNCLRPMQTTPEMYEDQQERVVLSRNLEGLYLGVSRHSTTLETKVGFDPYLAGIILAEGNVREVIKTKLAQDGVEFNEPSEKVVQVNDTQMSRETWRTMDIGSHKKTLPPGWLGLSVEDKGSLLAGLLDGDGTVEVGGTFKLYSTSWSLISQVQEIVRGLGGDPKVARCPERDNENWPCFYVSASLPKRLPSVKEISARQCVSSSKAYAKVVSVTQIPYDDWTYDLSTESRSFTANGIRTHNSFHTGGVAGARGSGAKSEFERVKELVELKKMPRAAVLAKATGPVSKIEKDKVTGGHRVLIGDADHFVPALKGAPSVTVGQEIKKGDSLSFGPKNPLELLPLAGMGAVQRYITDELSDLYKGQSTLHRKNAEVVVRNLTNLATVDDPGSVGGILRADRMSISEAESINRKLKPGQAPIKYTPLLKSVSVLPLEIQTDWVARLQASHLKRTLLDAAADGWSSDIHSVHPIPGMARGTEFGQGTPKDPWKY